jgi:uncharacterized protein with HEPN domain
VSREARLYVQDILMACEKIQRYTTGLTRDEFLQDERTYDAVIRNLLIIGEATKHLPEDIRALRPDITWRKIAGMRDIVVHVYFGIDDNVLWDVVTVKIPELYGAVVEIRDQL